ncbi:DEAD/DEAH box helicase [Tenacibaculum jejuense]|uniref:Putative Phospholipase D/transphosphatidylase n=1 Tax=Tenacibaculum jejuense TaxID=584609 RepID=A0A238UD92_9FLAO|nr:AAA domain-containing protein [Tenacibaculum jejuense]SNR16370.1 putative Phospholipase D/transphosphatidylase [Tenacibaculum jejuense]
MNEKNWLHYYKNSLTDSENLAVDIAKIKNLYHQNNSDLSNGFINNKQAEALIDAEERRINRLRGILKKDSSNWHEIDKTKILIAPFHLEYQTDNPKFKQKLIHPFWIYATVNRLGQLSAPKDIFPLIVRNYMTPMADVKNDFIFTSIDTVLDAKEIEPPMPEYEDEVVPWNEYWDYINEVFNAITYKNLYQYRAEKYTTQFKLTYFSVSSKISTAKSILFLYENLLNYDEELPLLSKIITPEQVVKRDAITDHDFLNFNHLHLGQMSDSFPLSVSQRKTLLSYLSAEESSVTAVNGPPGTGKTTLLQSLVATEVVRSAIIGEEPPIVLACSNNNQAVTNIIDSFINSESSLTELSKRWIPNFKGYATYLPSNGKNEKYLGDINFLKGNLFGHEGTLCNLENEEYLEDAEYNFLTEYCNYFNVQSNSIEDAIDHIQDEILIIEEQLIDSVDFPRNHIKSINFINKTLLNEEDHVTRENFNIGKLTAWRTTLSSLKASYKKTDFLPLVKEYFKVNSEELKEPKEWVFKIGESTINDKEKTNTYLKELINHLNIALQTNLKLKSWRKQMNIESFPILKEEELWASEFEKLNSKNTTPRFYYDELDVSLRHKAFLLATHYWEGRWLLATREALEEDTERGTGEQAIMLKWKRRAMLTPCFVATFYMAPSHFLYSQYQGENENGKPIFEYFPLYNFIDLLIIDEAGQVTPEVSIPVFAIAKKAFVVGDLKQIEPIWSIPSRIDKGNLSSLNIIQQEQDMYSLENSGFLASNGCIMKMAQNSCEYETPINNTKEQGLILLEHRRCNDEIIDFCNELAYGGILKPMKGKAREGQAFPSMMAYHINGVSERKYNSRQNIQEVKAIITWLQQNKEKIQDAYNVDHIEEVLGIITPFASQKGELSKALIEAGFKVSNIKLGTVHALQGAERSIILFSSVYTNEDEGTMFFEKDNKPNMLNVSVSRAKDSFILFGDTRIFDETKNTPSGVLKKHLNIYEMAT